MHDYLLAAFTSLCILPAGLMADECNPAVLAKRDTFNVPEGGSLSLSCLVQHCGGNWTGNWMWKSSTDEKLIENSDRYRLTNMSLSANTTKLLLNFLRVNRSDEGSYGCKVTWSKDEIEQGHLMYVNVTAAVPSERNLLHRFLVCAAAFLCLPVVLGLARCLSSGAKHQLPEPLLTTQSVHTEYRDQPHPAPNPLPRRPIPKKRSAFPRKASPQSNERAEVVYADISQNALSEQGAAREPAHSTVYSSVRFS